MRGDHLELGRLGEEAAARYLQAKGYKILDRNARNALGELDIVALDGRTVVVAEVKTRRDVRAHRPADNVHAHKRRKLAQVAALYLKHKRLADYPVRFDVLEVALAGPEAAPAINHMAGAFTADGF